MNMSWLPPSADFSKKINAVKKAPLEGARALLTALAQTDLNFLETIQLDKVLKEKVWRRAACESFHRAYSISHFKFCHGGAAIARHPDRRFAP